ncbi:MAG: hypothetical protein R3A44_42790 [Caldilineaceae bacterium]
MHPLRLQRTADGRLGGNQAVDAVHRSLRWLGVAMRCDCNARRMGGWGVIKLLTPCSAVCAGWGLRGAATATHGGWAAGE